MAVIHYSARGLNAVCPSGEQTSLTAVLSGGLQKKRPSVLMTAVSEIGSPNKLNSEQFRNARERKRVKVT